MAVSAADRHAENPMLEVELQGAAEGKEVTTGERASETLADTAVIPPPDEPAAHDLDSRAEAPAPPTMFASGEVTIGPGKVFENADFSGQTRVVATHPGPTCS